MKKIVVWDLGATKCAAALIEGDAHQFHFIKKCSIKLIACHSLDDLINTIEQALDIDIAHTDAICIGAAGTYNDGLLELASGYPYPMTFKETAHERRWPTMTVIHDYAPIVCATFTSYMENKSNVTYLNSQPMNPFGRRVALGIGTGLGVKDGVLLKDGDFWLGQNEMGHIGIPSPPSVSQIYRERHRALMHYLRKPSILRPEEPLTFEKILSGPGIVRLYQFCYPSTTLTTPEAVGEKMRLEKSSEVHALLAWYIGLFVGTVQLTFMPDGGTWITGGVTLNNLHLFDHAEFFNGIDASPSYLPRRQTFPLGILCNPDHAFWGGAYYATKRLMKT